MRNVTVLLVYETPGGSPLTVARVSDRSLVSSIAQAAIVEAESRAEELGQADSILGELERAEAGRLRAVINLLVPDLHLNRATARQCGVM